MSSSSLSGEFIPVNIAVLTVSDTRNAETDNSGRLLA
jgi:molybdopterin biosynthesis enzyme MoaB